MKKLIIATLILIESSFSLGNWVYMKKTGSQKIDYAYSKCFYTKSFGGDFSISIVVQGGVYSCPYSIQYNPLNNQWK